MCTQLQIHTFVHITPINKPNDNLIMVSLQRLSCCRSGQLNTANPWMRYGKTRKRHQLQRSNHNKSSQPIKTNVDDVSESTEEVTSTTRRGRLIKTRACVIFRPVRLIISYCSG